jgi:hypothetical protein
MPQLVVHIRKDGEQQVRPAYAVWVSGSTTAVRAFGPEWEEQARNVEMGLRSSRLGFRSATIQGPVD